MNFPPVLLAGMALGFVIGCCVGANFAASAQVDPVLAALQEDGGSGIASGNFLSALCVYSAYGFVFLLLSTTYIGFFLIPVAFGIKGFMSACTAAAFLESGTEHAFLLAGIAVGLPGLFLIPALLILGVLCALLSYRLFRQKQGCPPAGPPENHSRELAAVFVLLSLAAAAECYAVPYLAKLVLSS
ncbi:MAG: stage II sporulation protein M [Oscillospiraceae bacterium]